MGERTSPITPLQILCTISDSSLDLRVDIVVPSRGLGLLSVFGPLSPNLRSLPPHRFATLIGQKYGRLLVVPKFNPMTIDRITARSYDWTWVI